MKERLLRSFPFLDRFWRRGVSPEQTISTPKVFEDNKFDSGFNEERIRTPALE